MGTFGYDKSQPITRQSLMSNRLRICVKDTELAIGTGFFVQSENDKIFLATNWHNVTGRDPITHACKSRHLAIPDSIIVQCYLMRKSPNGEEEFKAIELTLPLYHDDELLKARWLEHAVWKENVDVVLIPLGSDQLAAIPLECSLIPAERGDIEMQIEVGMDVAILGYPRGISGGHFPIWKRGAIASEPYHRIDDLPKFYIDSATREGMSGSPVYACASGPIRFEGIPYVGQSQGVVRRLLGVYSGRVGNDALGAQLGIVWKESVIAEILGFGSAGQSSVLLTDKFNKSC